MRCHTNAKKTRILPLFLTHTHQAGRISEYAELDAELDEIMELEDEDYDGD